MLGECAGEKPAGELGDHVAVRKNGTLLDSEARAEILRRIEALTPRSERKWGRMTPHQMVCHLSDACRAALGDRRVSVIGTLWERTMIRWLAIHTSVKWPQGVRTVPEADQEIGGTRPTEFARDVDELRRSDSTVQWSGSAALRRPSVVWRPVGSGMGQIQLPSCGSSPASIRCLGRGQYRPSTSRTRTSRRSSPCAGRQTPSADRSLRRGRCRWPRLPRPCH